MKRYWVQVATVVVLLGIAAWQELGRSAPDSSRTAAVAQQAGQQARAGAAADVLRVPYVARLSPEAKRRLQEQQFVVVPEGYRGRAAGLYYQFKKDNIPIFVSSDIMLHTSHQLFDWCLRFLEMGHLRSDVLNLTDAMLREMMTYHGEAKDGLAKEAALLGAAYFTTAKLLLEGGQVGDIPEPYRTQIAQELELVRGAAGLGVSPLMGYREDYSQYKPRGHYSRSEIFERYFHCLMWYGRMAFRVSPAALGQPGVELDQEGIKRQALAAAMIVNALRSAKVKGEVAQDVWKRIYETTAYFAGPSDDLTFLDCEPAVTAAFGAAPQAAEFDDQGKLTEFMSRVQTLRRPQVLSTLAVWRTQPDWQQQTQAISFFGQRFSVDGLIIQRLTFDSVGQWRGLGNPPFTATKARGMWIRSLPRGLDIIAALGSEAALEILQAEGDTAYADYDERLQEIRQTMTGLGEKGRARDLYMDWLAALRAAVENAPANAPEFARSDPWRAKQAHTALGSWTELKHDTILYTKQSYTMAQAAMAGETKGGPPPPEPKLTQGYVEPVPEVFKRLRDAVEGLRAKLGTLGYPRDTALEDNLRSYGDLLGKLEAIAKKELAGQLLSQEEYDLIWNIGNSLSLYLAFPHHTDVSVEFMEEMDLQMPIVADVATDVNSKTVLEQALGWPMAVYVIAPAGGKPTVCKGVTYSYYEFKQPMDNRLTDEQWRDMLRQDKAPAPPQWTQRFVSVKAN